MKKLFLILFICFAFTSQAKAALIVDLGVPPANNIGVLLGEEGYRAREFNISVPSRLLSVEGWLTDWNVEFVNTPDFTRSGTVTAAIYSDGGVIPNVFNEIYRETFSTVANPFPHADWYGIFDINLALEPGQYWAAFEVRPGDTYRGRMPLHQTHDHTPGHASFYDGRWRQGRGSYPAWRIAAEALATGASPAVPEPTTMALMGLGLAGAGFLRRKKK